MHFPVEQASVDKQARIAERISQFGEPLGFITSLRFLPVCLKPRHGLVVCVCHHHDHVSVY